jgi:hypothetical protein
MQMRELPHYTIGDSYGGNQDWFTEPWMNRGGCGALTACDMSIYLARYMGRSALYPFDPERITRSDYLTFGAIMRPFLSPRPRGINKTRTFMDGFRDYMRFRRDTALKMTSVEGDAPYETAREAVRDCIDRGFPIPYLMLLHRDKALDDFNWHWFLLNGYDASDQAFLVKAVTYGSYEWLDLRALWDTGYERRGGLVLYHVD